MLVDQEIREALKIADYVYVLELGRNKFEGPPAEFTDLEEGLLGLTPRRHLAFQPRHHHTLDEVALCQKEEHDITGKVTAVKMPPTASPS